MTRPIDDIDFEIGGVEIAMQVLQKRWKALAGERSYALSKVMSEVHGPPPELPKLSDVDVREGRPNKH